MHVVDFHICTLCRKVMKNPTAGRTHLRLNHREEYIDYVIDKNPLDLLQRQDDSMFNASLAVKYENKEN